MHKELQWTWAETGPQERIRELSDTLSIPPVIASILINRGIETADDAKFYFRAGLENLHDPFLMADMHKAADRIVEAVKAGQAIRIYGDYDVDGATSTSLLILFFRQLGISADFIIPNRIRDGYGVSIEGIEKARNDGIDLLITVDCGITANDEVERGREIGLDIIVCDHHQPAEHLPDAIAVLDPKRPDCPYPFKELAGVGVAFKLAQAVAMRLGHDMDQLYSLLDLVAIGSAADIVPLVDENRILVRTGLEILNTRPNTGLKALLETTRLAGKSLSTGQVIFVLAPRINAVGRMGDASHAVNMFITEDDREALQIAHHLEEENKQRRNIDEETFREACEMIEAHFDPENDSVFVLSSEGWHPGVIGIVASRLVERYYRPTVMISTDDGVGKGSARSVSGFDIYDALENCSDLMRAFGGHKYAAGLSISSEDIGELRERLEAYAKKQLTPEMRTRKLKIEADIRFGEIDGKFLRLIKMMEPYGPQNMRPVFSSKGVRVVGTPGVVGRNHLRLRFFQDGKVFDSIGFNLGDLLHRVQSNPDNLDIAYTIEENEWQGRVTTQLRLKDIH